MAAKQAGLKLVQYVAVRGDLVKEWPLGAIVAQACHASTAVMHMFRDDPYTVEYLSDLDRMHKVVLKVSVCTSLGGGGVRMHVLCVCIHTCTHTCMYTRMCAW